MARFRVIAGCLVLLAVAAAVTLGVGAGVPLWRVAAWLGEHGGIGYPIWIGWTLIAPVVLLAGAALARRSPWPWMVVAVTEVLAATALIARVSHLAPWWLWLWWLLVVLCGVGSLLVVGRLPDARPE